MGKSFTIIMVLRYTKQASFKFSDMSPKKFLQVASNRSGLSRRLVCPDLYIFFCDRFES